MGAPPGFKAGYSEREKREIKERNQRREFENLEAWEKRRKVEVETADKEKRGYDIFRKGDLARNTKSNGCECCHPKDLKRCEIAVIVEAEYRSFIVVLTANGETCRWRREDVEVIGESR